VATLSSDRVSGVARRGGRARTPATAAAAVAAADGPFVLIVIIARAEQTTNTVTIASEVTTLWRHANLFIIIIITSTGPR